MRPVASALQKRIRDAQGKRVHVGVDFADLESLVLRAHADASEVSANTDAIGEFLA
jgi:hypothetical protein